MPMLRPCHLLAVFTLSLMSCVVNAQAYPTRPVRFLVPFPPGTGVDIVARMLSQKLGERWSQSVIVDNRSGAGGIVASDIAAKSPPDGYTILMGNLATHALNPSLYKSLPYDPIREFAPVTQVVSVPEILVVNAGLPVQSVKELIAYARSKPGQLNYGSAGIGSMPHLSGELFNALAKVQTVHVAYKGNPQATTDLLGGQVQMMFGNLLSLLPHAKAGRVRGLAVTTSSRSPAAPSLPTMIEAGVPGYEATNWYGVLAPAKTPKALVTALHAAIADVLRAPEVRAKLEQDGADVVGSTPQQFEAHIVAETRRWRSVISQAGIQPQ